MMRSIKCVGKILPILALAGGLTSTFVGVPAVQAEGRPFLATAEAKGVYARYGIPGFLLVDNYVDAGGPMAQATFGSEGVANSFASLPYPGPTASSYPLVVALVTGSAPPGYPFTASASHPTQPEGKVSDPSGSYTLSAAANETRSISDARFSPGGPDQKPRTQAQADVVPDGSQVTATARSLAEGITIGPLSIGLVRSESVTTYRQGDAEPTTQTQLVVEGGRAGEASFTFGRDGLKVAQQGIPVPAEQGLTTLNQALAPAGLSLRFQEVTKLTGGAVAAGLEVASVNDVPGAGKGYLSLLFGGATSFVSLGADGDAPETVGGAPLDPSPQPAAEPVAPPSGATALLAPDPDVVPVESQASTYPSPGAVTSGPAVTTEAGLAGVPEPTVRSNGSAPAATETAVALPAAGLASVPRQPGATSLLAGLLLAGGLLGTGAIAWGARKRRRPWML